MKIAIGSDHNGFNMKEVIKAYLQDENYQFVDYGCYTCDAIDYPDVAFQVASDIRKGKVDRGILICGTGIGVAIAACKYPGIRAALCHDTYSAERAQLSNNAQIITMGGQIIGTELAKKVVATYLNSSWAGGSERKVNKITAKEKEFIEKSTN